MLKVGLTGSIGTGKSTVAKIFQELGAYVIDADKIVHQLLKKEDVKQKIKEAFGNVFDENGEIDKKKLAGIVFNNLEKKKQLEGILHPLVFQEIQKWLKEIEKKDPEAVAIAEVPLMIETGSYKNYDKIIVVYAPEELQMERLVKKGMTKEEALRRIKSQMPIEEKIKYADIVIENTESIQKLSKKVEKVYELLKEEARS
ncbi:MAG: dephospho-CoA kinase [Aquificae bacterium]|nr:dephospho-CoA kinase [Aquificota bacterium]